MDKNKKNVPKIRFPGFEGPWEQRKVGEWGSFYYGHSCPKWSVTEDATTPCIRYGELYTKFGTKIDKVFSYTNMPTDKLRFSKGTEVLIPRVGEDPMDYNHCTWLSIPGVAIGEMISVFNTKQNPLFTATMFNATLQKEFASRVEGGSVTNLYYEKLKNIDVLYPSLEEQEKVAAFFEQIDNLITLHQRKLEHIQDKKKGLLQKMFPKEGEKFPELRFPGFTDPWEQCKLSDIVKLFGGNAFSSSNSRSVGIPWLKIANVGKNGVDWSSSSFLPNEFWEYYKDYRLYKGDYVMALTRPILNHILKIAIVDKDAMLNQRVAKLIFTTDSEYGYQLLQRRYVVDKIENELAGTDPPNLGSDNLKNINISITFNKDEQIKIGNFFKQIDKLINFHKRKLEHLQQQKKGLLQQMFI